MKEKKCIYKANERPYWDHLDGLPGVVKKDERERLVFYPKKNVFNSCYIVREENLEF